MNTVSELVKKNPMLVTVALAVAVILVIYMLWQGCMIMGIRLRTPAEGMGAGGPQVNDNALLPAGWEGYHVRRLEGVTGKDLKAPNSAMPRSVPPWRLKTRASFAANFSASRPATTLAWTRASLLPVAALPTLKPPAGLLRA